MKTQLLFLENPIFSFFKKDVGVNFHRISIQQITNYFRYCLFVSCLFGFGFASIAQNTNVPASGENFMTNNGQLTDNGGSGSNYGSNQDGFTFIVGRPGQTININGSYATENTYDFVYIYTVGTGGLTLVSSNTNSGTINYTGPASTSIAVRFYSDGSNVAAGFNFAVTFSGSASTSTVLVNGATPSLSCQPSPNGGKFLLADHNGVNGDYGSSRNDYIILDATSTDQISIVISANTEGSYDYVYIRSLNPGNTVLASYTGFQGGLFTGTTGQSYMLQFVSDGTTNYRGFVANVSYASNNVFTETTPTHTAPSPLASCNTGTFRLGSGAYFDLPVEANTYYNFSFNQNGATGTNAYSAVSQGGGSGASFSGTTTNAWFSGTTTSLRVSANRINCWTATSAIITYGKTTPTLAANSPASSTVCSSSLPVSVTGGTATNGTLYWQGTTSNGTSTATASSPNNATTAGTWYYRANNNGCWSTQQGTVITVNPSVTASVSIAATPGSNVCIGTNVTFTATPTNGGTPSYQWKLNGSNVGTNSPTYSNNALTNTSAVTCVMTSTATCATGSPATSNSISGIVPAAPTAIAGTATAVCQVPANSGWVRFLDGSGRLVVSINPGSNNLGLVTADVYDHGASVLTQACNTGTNPEWTTAVLGRSWRITPTNNLGASLELPFEDGEMSDLVTASSNTSSNPRDNVTSRGDLKMSRYSGASQNGSWSDNCADGGTSLIAGQLGSGTSPAGIATSQYVQFATPGFSEFWLHGNTTASPLPITLTNFGASCDEKGDVQLNWTTASEQNSSHFVIERSRDLVTWNVVSTLPAGGNTTTEQLYALTDVDALGGVSYYRLVQVDFDGESEIYGPISVTCESAEGNTMTVFPNPTKADFTVEITSISSVTGATLQLTDLTGKVIVSRQVDLVAGNNHLLFSDLDLQMGTYIIRIQSELEIRPVKLMVD